MLPYLKIFLEKILKKPLANEVIFYMFFGILTTIVGFVSYVLFLSIGFGVIGANTISHILATLFAYVTNKIWVFKKLDFSMGTVFKEFSKFVSGRFVVYVIDTVLLVILVEVLFYDPIISRIFLSFVVVALNYLVSKVIVFR